MSSEDSEKILRCFAQPGCRKPYPMHVRATVVSFCFNASRFIAFLGPLLAGTLITDLGDYGKAAAIVSMTYVSLL